MPVIGYARCSLDERDSVAQRSHLYDLGVDDEHMYLDHGHGTTRPELDQALAVVRRGDILVVTTLARLALSVPDARAIGENLAARGAALSLGGEEIYNPADLLETAFLGTFDENAVHQMRRQDGMVMARVNGKYRGGAPLKLSAEQHAELVRLHASGGYRMADLAGIFGIGPDTVLRYLRRETPPAAEHARSSVVP